MERTGGRVIVKAGAEALMCAGALEPGLGVALKVRDGSPRATGPALVAVLRALGLLDDGDVEALGPHAVPEVLGGGRPVGALETSLELASPA
jgi:L-asparaginase II